MLSLLIALALPIATTTINAQPDGSRADVPPSVSAPLTQSDIANAKTAADNDSRATPTATQPTNPAQWKAQQREAFAKSERIYQQALKQNGLLAQYRFMHKAASEDRTPAFRSIFSQYVSWYQTYLGDYAAARDTHSLQQVSEPDDNTSPLAGRFQARPAVEALLAMTKDRQVVFFNEAHTFSHTRIVTIEMLASLRAQGFDTFAVETLYDTDKDLQKRGYPNIHSGFYTQDPLYSEMVRTALKLGFTVIAYEAEKADGDAREREQAATLVTRVLKKNPQARLVVNAGFAHIQKSGKYLDGKSMAEHFKRLSGIDPLCIEQTMMVDHDTTGHDHPFYRAAIDSLHPLKPIIFVDAAGKPWSLKPAAYDVSVIFPPQVLRRGRPTWLEIDGARKPNLVHQAELCQKQSPCMVEARYADEGEDAIPADRLSFQNIDILGAEAVSELYLRPGNYRLVATDIDNRVLSRQTLNVAADTPEKKSP